MSIDIDSFIVHTPAIGHGRPRIEGTGITVHRIAIWYNLGYTPEEIACQYQHLSLVQVYAALAYYHANRVEIDADIADEEAEADRIEAAYLKTSKAPDENSAVH